MFDTHSPYGRGTVLRPQPPSWANGTDPTPRSNAKNGRKLKAPPPPIPQITIPESVSVSELWLLAGDANVEESRRLGFLVVSMWLARQPTAVMLKGKFKAGLMATEALQGTETATSLVEQLFPTEPIALVLRKARAMLVICNVKKHGQAKGLAMSHVSSKCQLTEEHIAQAEAYAKKFADRKPNANAFTTIQRDGTDWLEPFDN